MCLLVAGTACLVVWLLQRGEVVTEARDPEDKSVVLGVGDRKGLKDKIRDIYRRGRNKKGKEVRIIPPPEMELTNQIIVNSKEVDDDRDASQSREESEIEIEPTKWTATLSASIGNWYRNIWAL